MSQVYRPEISCMRHRRTEFRAVGSDFLVVSVIATTCYFSALPGFAQPHTRAPRNFFTEDQTQSRSEPGFNTPKLSEADKENRLVPDIRLVRSLPGLDNETRKKINAIYKTWQDGNADLRNQLQLNQSQVTKAALSIQSMALQTSARSSQEPRPEMLDSQNLHPDSAKLEDDSSAKSLSTLQKEQKHIRHELLVKRKELWESIKPLLSEQNLADLDKMRRGEYIPGSPMTSQETK